MTSDSGRSSAAAAYDAVAQKYAETYFGEFARKPFDREVLISFAASLVGPVADIGCGPGQVARFLADQGLEVLGFDLSPQMVERARDLNPGLPFEVADMRALPLPDAALGGAVVFYALIHLARTEVVSALRELRRVLYPGAPLLVSFHVGDGVTHLETWFDEAISLDFSFFGPEEMTGYAGDAGFAVEAVEVRAPYPFEVQTERAYLLLRKPTV